LQERSCLRDTRWDAIQSLPSSPARLGRPWIDSRRAIESTGCVPITGWHSLVLPRTYGANDRGGRRNMLVTY